MKLGVKKWKPASLSPWVTRSEVGDYLRWSVRSVDRCLVPWQKEPVPGKMRYVLQETDIRKVRILAQDMYAICPLPSSHEPELDEVPDPNIINILPLTVNESPEPA
jgi:hypothetical protein